MHACTNAFESPVERVLRLRREIKGFAAELTLLSVQTEAKGDASREARTVVQGLEQGMSALLSDERIRPYLQHNHTATHLLSGGDPVLHAAMDAAHGGEGFALSLASTAGVRAEALEAKLAAVEAVVGQTAGVGGEDLRTRLAKVQARIASVEVPQLDALSRRIQAVQADLLLHEPQRRATEGAPPSEATKAQVEELVAIEGKYAAQVKETPRLLKQLHEGQSTHASAADALTRLSNLAQQSEAIAEMLAADQEGLNSMQSSFGDNMQVMEANMVALEARLAAINKRC